MSSDAGGAHQVANLQASSNIGNAANPRTENPKQATRDLAREATRDLGQRAHQPQKRRTKRKKPCGKVHNNVSAERQPSIYRIHYHSHSTFLRCLEEGLGEKTRLTMVRCSSHHAPTFWSTGCLVLF
jgi:hypothetical protein